jgi:hypothetical protein
MNKKNILISVVAIMFLFAALFILIVKYNDRGAGGNGGGDDDKLFNFKKTDLSYYEYMYDDPGCRNGNCMKEYIVHSNGIVFFRDESVINGFKKTKINIGEIEKNKAEYLISYTGDHMQILNPEGIDCFNCGLVHIFYGDAAGKKSATSYIDASPQFMHDALAMTESEVKNAKFFEPFFVHIVFTALRGNSIDYHFYSDGTVLKEEFGEKNGEFLAFDIYTIEKSVMDKMKDSITGDHFLAEDSQTGCTEAGLKWGYIELEKGEDYNFVYTCGAGDSAVDKLFNELFEKTGGK